MKKYRVVFMGTPDFALPCLEVLTSNPSFDPVLVLSQPDSRQGRGMNLQAPPIKKRALELGLEVYQPLDLKDKEVQAHILGYDYDFLITAAYGLLVPDELLAASKVASFNLHASLLPALRGSAPIQRAIFEGCEETGITSMFMISELDAGDILLQEKVTICPDETYGSLYDRLKNLASQLLINTCKGFIEGSIKPIKQDTRYVSYAPSIEKEDQKIDWSDDAVTIFNQIRGLNPIPGAYTEFQGKILKIWRGKVLFKEHSAEGGTVLKSDSEGLWVACKKGVLSLLEVQPAGKKIMNHDAFLRGNPLKIGDRFEYDKQEDKTL